MTMPFSDTMLHGARLGDWRAAARAALAALESDPADEEALTQLRDVQSVLQEFAGSNREGTRDASPLAARMGIRNRNDEAEARDLSPGVSLAQGATQGATFGFADEAAGALRAIPALLPGGESPRQAYLRNRDEQRAFDAQARDAHPGMFLAGEVSGGLASGIPGSGAVIQGTRLGRNMAAGSRLGATTAQKIRATLAGGGLAGIEGAIAGYGYGEEGPIDDLSNAAITGAISVPFGVVGTALAGRFARRSSLQSAQEQAATNRVAESAAITARSQEQARLAALAREQAETLAPYRQQTAANRAALSQAQVDALPETEVVRALRLAEAEARAAEQAAVRPARIQSAQDRATLTRARVEDLPQVREVAGHRADLTATAAEQIPLRQQMLEDQAVITALRRAAMERGARGAAGRGAQAATGTGAEDAARRGLARIGMAPDAIEAAINRQRSMPSSPLFRGNAEPSPLEAMRAVTETPTPRPTSRTAPAPETGGGPTVTQPASGYVRQQGAEAARGAYGVADAAREAGMPVNPNEAAARAAAQAREVAEAALPAAADDLMPDLQRSVRINEIIAGEPSEEAGQELLELITGLAPEQYQKIVPRLSVSWRQVLGFTRTP